MQSELLQAFIATLECRDVLSDGERELIFNLPWRLESVQRHQEIVRQGSTLSDSTLLIEGRSGRVSFLRNGGRQFTGFNVPGDFVDLPSFFLKSVDHSVVAVTQCTYARVSHDALRAISEKEPHLWRLFSMLVAIEGAMHRIWILNLGRRSPPRHLAHLICELQARLDITGQDAEESIPFPVTQTELGDILGISVVHTNRSVKKLRQAGLIEWTGRRLRVLDWQGLKSYADFDGMYLNAFKTPR